MSECTEMYRIIFYQNVGKCTEKTISKVIWVGKGTLDVILSQINKKIGDLFHFQWYRRRLNYQFSNYVTDKVNGSRVQPSLSGEDQRPDPGDGGNRAYLPGVILLFKIGDASGERKYLITVSNLTELTLTINKSSKNVLLKYSFNLFYIVL